MRLCAGVITWMLIFGYFVLLTTLGVLCLYKSYNDNSNLHKDLQNEGVLQFLGYFFLILAALSFLLFICFFSKIKKAIAIMKTASDFVREAP